MRFWAITYFFFLSMICYSQRDKPNLIKNEISIIIGTGLTKLLGAKIIIPVKEKFSFIITPSYVMGLETG